MNIQTKPPYGWCRPVWALYVIKGLHSDRFGFVRIMNVGICPPGGHAVAKMLAVHLAQFWYN